MRSSTQWLGTLATLGFLLGAISGGVVLPTSAFELPQPPIAQSWPLKSAIAAAGLTVIGLQVATTRR
ncbi:hypothetical protein [Synechococcus elongatus]|uniref:hypothetical protein n=1 Tax=Synechococcus elongatus TaxID=32046 RepID=UPI00004600E5|nr:hypothetical protein [Synechococcus elongatus]AJD58840.1 hypothetical protein M744_01035 [Synechococcus elongatus UTEX 2973]MBD2588258.1 hypothetical protein [Synechococcus elongatus FACHB-242]MBD2689326.1 hypothetical protein [Synechococcus elongatus FACHB-1061]MBD2707034.1 hypothetical protein [Synechococcus elongatus PCC 7942 = FACHB-805]UOW70176.1 hypothetical protein PCC7943_0402 [Synechococcus elongatus PCC 7943]